MKRLVLVGLIVLTTIAAACGGSGGSRSDVSGDDRSSQGHDMGGETMTGEVMGEVADAADADRTITIDARDELKFESSEIEVSVGEVVTFVVVNDGDLPHEFVLGDDAYQSSHEGEMSGGQGSGTANMVSVDSGETKQLTWRFTQEGEVLYGCHVPGHYEGGMVGTIRVT